MSNVIDAVLSKDKYIGMDGVNIKEIQKAERELKLHFSQEYKEYLKKFAIVAYSGHELTGISSSERTNVVNVTRKYKEIYNEIPDDCYVIEDTNYDGMVIWQDTYGYVYKNINGCKLKKIYESMAEYISM